MWQVSCRASIPPRGVTAGAVLRRECSEGMRGAKVMRSSCIVFSVDAAGRAAVLGYYHSDAE